MINTTSDYLYGRGRDNKCGRRDICLAGREDRVREMNDDVIVGQGSGDSSTRQCFFIQSKLFAEIREHKGIQYTAYTVQSAYMASW